MNCFTNRYHCCFIAWPIHFKTVYLFEEELLRNNVNELISSSPFLYNFSQFQFKTTSLHVIYLTTNIAFSLPLFLFPLCKADFLFLFTTKAHFFSTLRYFPSLSLFAKSQVDSNSLPAATICSKVSRLTRAGQQAL